MSSCLSPAPSDSFQRAWGLMEGVGLVRPSVPVVPDPVVAAHDKTAGWLLARARSEVVGFQQAIGDWSQPPPMAPLALSQALSGLRRLSKGPDWWRQLIGPWRRREVTRWRGELVQEIHRLRHSVADVEAVLLAHQAVQKGLGQWRQWAEHALPSPISEHWSAQCGVLEATLEMLGQRLSTRQQVERSQLEAIQKALALVDIVRHARGSDEDRVLLEVADKAARALKAMRD